MWIHEAAHQEKLAILIEHCAALKLVSGPDGQIYYANAAFREFTEYSLPELMKLGWKQLSVDNESLTADVEAVKQIQDGYMQSYTIQKQYRKKSGAAQWGNLTVLRYPAAGPIECFFCTFEPFKNGTSLAFAMAMDNQDKIEKRLGEMAKELTALTTTTDEAKWINATISMAKNHPRIAISLLVAGMTIFGLNNVVELLQRTGVVQLPIPVKTQANGDEHPTAATIAKNDRKQLTDRLQGFRNHKAVE